MNDFQKACLKKEFLEKIEDYIPDIHEQQRQYAEYFIDTLLDENYARKKPIVIPCRCGCGKSQCVQAFCESLAYLEMKEIGVIIVTDSLERLKILSGGEIVNDPWGGRNSYSSKGVYISSEVKELSAREQLIKAKYKQFVFMSSQRLKDLSEYDLKEDLLTFKCDDKLCKRKFLLIDEKPIAYEYIPIGRKEINDVSTAISEGVPTSEADRNFVIDSYENLRKAIIDDFLRVDNHSENTLTDDAAQDFFVKHFNLRSLTTNDKLFFDVIDKHKKAINNNRQLNSKSYEILHYLKKIIRKGVIVKATKSSKNSIDSGSYELSMYYLKNNMSSLMQDIKTIVLDATAGIEPIYLHKDFVMMDNLAFEPLKPLKIVNVDTNVNRTSTNDKASDLNERKKNIEYLSALADDLHSRAKNDTLIVCYQQCEEYFQKGNTAVAHFGNVRGSNEWYNFDNVAQFGLNRQSGFDYLMNYFFIDTEGYNELLKLDEAESRKKIAELLKISKGIFEDGRIHKICMNRAIADLEQNLFRCSLRNFNSITPVTLYLYCNQKYMGTVGSYFNKKWNADIETVNSAILDEFKDRYKKPRKQNPDSTAGKIMEYIDSLSEGTEFRVKDILDNCQISKDQFKSAKKHNKKLSELLKSINIDVGRFRK